MGSQNNPLLKGRNYQWHDLPLNELEDTYRTLQLYCQIVGKIKLQFCSFINHWWHITFIPTTSGLTTGIIPYSNKYFQIDFDFITHHLRISTDQGEAIAIELKSGSIAEFYFQVKEKLKSLGIEINIWTVPVEKEDRTPFEKDNRIRIYNPDHAYKHWQVLLQVYDIMNAFRSGFTGKASPVHFFWGAIDLAVTFFSGRPAPKHPGAPNIGKKVTIEGYNKELASFGFWGGIGAGEAAFYAYAYPEPLNYKNYNIQPGEAYYDGILREFILPYSAIKKSDNPVKKILTFYHSALNAAVDLSSWDRSLFLKEHFSY